MINISHVKKYEQPYKKYTSAILTILVLTCHCNTYAQKIQQDPKKTELPTEISEKFYKKEAILKFNEAVKKWESTETSNAIKLWKESLEIDPNLWISYLGLGQAYDSIKEYKKALDSYKSFLKLAPSNIPDRKSVNEAVNYLSYILRNGEEVLKGDDYLSLVKTKHQGKEHFVRWDLSNPIKIYFYPAHGVKNYREEFKDAFLSGARLWQEGLPELNFDVLDNSILVNLKQKEREKKEKELIEQAQIKVVFPSKFAIKGAPNNKLAQAIDAQSFPIIRDKTNFRVLGVVMISPFIYHQAQIAIPLEPLSKLVSQDQIEKLKIIGAREVGHTLGLWGFSPNPDDLMFEGEVKELKLSERDKNTIKKLYELDPEEEDLLTN